MALKRGKSMCALGAGRQHSCRWRAIIVSALLLPALLCRVYDAYGEATRPPLEYQVKASMMYNFLQLIEWPPEVLPPGDDLVVCTLGEDHFGPALNPLEKELVRGHRIRLHRLERLQEQRSCHAIFISSSVRDRLASVLPVLSDRSVLTIGESPDFLELGGIINFQVEDGKLRFSINEEASLKARLKISAKLLSLASSVRRR